MAQPTRRVSTVTVNNPVANSVALDTTGYSVGDGGIIVVTCDSNIATFLAASPTGVPTGWTERTNGTQSAQVAIRWWTKAALEVGDANPTIDFSTSVDTGRFTAINPNGGTLQFDNVGVLTFDDGTPTDSVAGPVTVAADGYLYCEFVNDNVRTVSGNPSGMTIVATDPGVSITTSAWDQETAGAGITKTLTWSSGEQVCAIAIAVSAPSAGGPTIDTQPTAQVAVLNPSVPAVFTLACAAAITSMLWELETAVAGGSYAAITSGVGGFVISTNTGAGTSSLTYTGDATTHHGKRIRGTPTDGGGSTVSNAVALSVFEGWPVTDTTTTTDASGETTGSATGDYTPTDFPGGALVLFEATRNGESFCNASHLVFGETP